MARGAADFRSSRLVYRAWIALRSLRMAGLPVPGCARIPAYRSPRSNNLRRTIELESERQDRHGSHARSWVLIFSCAWIVLNGLVLLGPSVLHWMFRPLLNASEINWTNVFYGSPAVISTVVGVLSGIISLAGGFSGKSLARPEPVKSKTSIFLSSGKIAAIVFLGIHPRGPGVRVIVAHQLYQPRHCSTAVSRRRAERLLSHNPGVDAARATSRRDRYGFRRKREQIFSAQHLSRQTYPRATSVRQIQSATSIHSPASTIRTTSSCTISKDNALFMSSTRQ